MGEFGEPPGYYAIWRAAKILNMPFDRLGEHPERKHLLNIAFNCQAGQSDGEYQMRTTAKFKKQVKDYAEATKIK